MDWDAAIRADLAPMVPYAPGLRECEVRERAGTGSILKLSSNEHPAGPFPAAIRAIQAELPDLNRYPDGSARALRRVLCDHLGVADEHLVVGNGSNEIIRLIASALLHPADEVVFAWPSFVVYPMVVQMCGATAVRVPLAVGEVHDLRAMLAAITERTRILFLCNPNNPTGTIYRRQEFAEFLSQIPPHVLGVVDEAYFEFVTDPDYPDALEFFDGERSIAVLRTFSKIHSLAGLRIGYGVMPAPLASALHKIREPFNVNSIAQVAAYHSLGEHAEIERRRIENATQRERLYAAFDALGISYIHSEANFVYVHTDRPVEVFEALLGQGVIVRDFGTAPALRVGIGTPEDTTATIGAFQAVADLLGSI